MGESPSARTERELARLRAEIDRDIDALVARVREDVDPRRLFLRQPLAVAGSALSVAAAAAIGLFGRTRRSKVDELKLDALVERLGGRLDKLKGDARKRFRKQLQKEMAEVEHSGPKEVAWGAVAAGLTALATAVAQALGRRLLRDEPTERSREL